MSTGSSMCMEPELCTCMCLGSDFFNMKLNLKVFTLRLVEANKWNSWKAISAQDPIV